MNAAAYCRVSSASQSQRMQIDAITKSARARGDKVTQWYSDKVSGASLRPELERLRNDARAGKVRRLYVYRLDRLSRRGIAETVSLVKEFKQCGAELVLIADGFSLEGDSAEVIVAVLSWAAQMERAAINERTEAARARALAKGEPWGRPRRVDDLMVARVRKAKKKDAALTVREIAIALKIPKLTVDRILSQKGAYKGPVMAATNHGKKKVAPPLSR